MKKYVNGIEMDMTAEEIAEKETQKQNHLNTRFDRAMADLRAKRNRLLAETDYLALSDNTMSSEMTTYRQNLRDITEGITTVEEVNAIVFPTKPTE